MYKQVSLVIYLGRINVIFYDLKRGF